jgi:hypothetical protein
LRPFLSTSTISVATLGVAGLLGGGLFFDFFDLVGGDDAGGEQFCFEVQHGLSTLAG